VPQESAGSADQAGLITFRLRLNDSRTRRPRNPPNRQTDGSGGPLLNPVCQTIYATYQKAGAAHRRIQTNGNGVERSKRAAEALGVQSSSSNSRLLFRVASLPRAGRFFFWLGVYSDTKDPISEKRTIVSIAATWQPIHADPSKPEMGISVYVTRLGGPRDRRLFHASKGLVHRICGRQNEIFAASLCGNTRRLTTQPSLVFCYLAAPSGVLSGETLRNHTIHQPRPLDRSLSHATESPVYASKNKSVLIRLPTRQRLPGFNVRKNPDKYKSSLRVGRFVGTHGRL